ncbi:MAG: hypothetical protein KDD55_07075 [Bdellovibrionales bacterium]|nr:hypothetical protein [Bdellovibrionales bacterium]
MAEVERASSQSSAVAEAQRQQAQKDAEVRAAQRQEIADDEAAREAQRAAALQKQEKQDLAVA